MRYSDGILLIDKPFSWSSFDVVAKLRGALKRESGKKKIKVGHAGTLDPLATGLLIVLVGSYCKQAADFSKFDKRYRATMKLGYESTTGDEEGEKRAVSHKQPGADQVARACQSFIGEYDQVPPAFSAKKVNGKRAYSLARRGEVVDIAAKRIKIVDLAVLDYTYPFITIDTTVSSGTYVRTLAEDIGKALQCGAYVTELRRTQVGSHSVDSAHTIEQVSDEPAKYLLTNL